MNHRIIAGAVAVALSVHALMAIAGSNDVSSLARAGAVKIGEGFSSLRKDAAPVEDGAPGDSDAADCTYYKSRLLPVGVSMMVEDGVVVRFDVADAKGKGPFGVMVGDTEASARAKMPRHTVVGPDTYGTEADHYLTWRDTSSGLAFRVENIAGKVTGMYWGRWKAVQYVEGCL